MHPLSVPTPPAPDPGTGPGADPVPAPLGVRFGALLADVALSWALPVAGMVLAAVVGLDGSLGVLVGWVAWLVWWVKAATRGTSPGKAMLGLVVADVRTGQPVGLGRMLVREIPAKWVSGLVLGLGFLWVLARPDRRGWHDLLTGTIVTRA